MRFGAYEQGRTNLFDFKLRRAFEGLKKDFPESQAFIRSYRPSRINLESATGEIKRSIVEALVRKWQEHPDILRQNIEHWGSGLTDAVKGLLPKPLVNSKSSYRRRRG